MKKITDQQNLAKVAAWMKNAIFAAGFLLVVNCVQANDINVDALPTNGQVVAGDAHIAAGGTAAAPVLNVNQTSQRAVVSWDKFDVGSAATVNFNQPNAQASTLNKITSGSPSKIMGKINAPGEVILVNQSGVYFTPSATLDVGSVVATSHDIGNADYMAGKATYDRNGATGKVINEGNIKTALGGYVALLAPEVRNSGVIVAQMGTVVLAAGERITLNFDPSRHLASITATPSAIDALIENRSAVKAPGGLIILSARAVNTLTAGVIKQSGTISASADANTIVKVGGRIMLSASTVKLEAGSQTVARGANGGGAVEVVASKTVTVEPTAKVSVSATETGNAGTINIHADEKTTINGTLLAQGGNQSGNGGVINTTSHGQVEIGNTAEIKAGVRGVAGHVGTWNLTAAAMNINHAVAGVISQSLNTNNVAIKATATQLTIDPDASIQKTSPVLTQLSLEAEQSVTIAGQILSGPLSPMTLEILSQNAVDLQQTSSIQSREVLVAAPNINSVGDVYAYLFGGNNGAIPLISFLASRISVAGNLRAGANSRAGKISLSGTDQVTIANANIAANGNDGGVVEIISMNGTVSLMNSVVQTNGGEGRGGAISVAGLQQTLLNATTLEATGKIQGGKILVGNDAQNGTLPFSVYTSIDASSIINASQVSTTSTNGGFIETSAHTINLLGSINAGRGGIWLIDPYDITIGATEAGYIVTALNAGTNVSISTANSSNTAGSNTISGASGNGNIYVLSAISANTTCTSNCPYLALGADGAIVITADIKVPGELFIGGTGLQSSYNNVYFGLSTYLNNTSATGDNSSVDLFASATSTSAATNFAGVNIGGAGCGSGIVGCGSLSGRNPNGVTLSAGGNIYIAGQSKSVAGAEGVIMTSESIINSINGSINIYGASSQNNALHISWGSQAPAQIYTLAANTNITLWGLTNATGSAGTIINGAYLSSPAINIYGYTGTTSTSYYTAGKGVDLGSSYGSANMFQTDNLSISADAILFGQGGSTTPVSVTGSNNYLGSIASPYPVTVQKWNTAYTAGDTSATSATLTLSTYTDNTNGLKIYTRTYSNTVAPGGAQEFSTAYSGISDSSTWAAFNTTGLSNSTALLFLGKLGGITLGNTNRIINTPISLVGDLTVKGNINLYGKSVDLGTYTLTENLSSASILIKSGSDGIANASGSKITTASGVTGVNLELSQPRTQANSNRLDTVISGGIAVTFAGHFDIAGANTYTGDTTTKFQLNFGSLKFISSYVVSGSTITSSPIGKGNLILVEGTSLDLNGNDIGSATTYISITMKGSGTNTVVLWNKSTTASVNVYGNIIFDKVFSTSASQNFIAQYIGATMTVWGIVSDCVSTCSSGNTNFAPLGIGVTTNDQGTVVFTNANTYSGMTNVKYGILKAGSATPFGTGDISVVTDGKSALDLNGQTITSTNALTLNGNGFYDGSTRIYSGALMNSSTTSATYPGLVTLAGSTRITGDTGKIILSNTGTIAGNFPLSLDGAQGGTIASVIGNGANNLIKNGTGTWLLSGVNIYTGSTLINAGILAITSDRSLGAVPISTTNNSISLTGVLQGVGIDGQTSANVITLDAKRGVYISASTGGIAADTTTTNGITYQNVLNVQGIVYGSYDLTINGAGQGGKVILSGANTYTGKTTISGGILSVSDLGGTQGSAGGTASGIGKSGNAAANLVINGGTLQYTGIAASSDRLFTLGSNGGAIDASGTGELTWNGNGSGAANAIAITAASSPTLTLTGSGLGTLRPILANAGTGYTSKLTKTGTGTWTLLSVNTYTGATNINNGVLKQGINNPFGAGVTINSSGTLDLAGFIYSDKAITLNGGTITSSRGSGAIKSSGVLTSISLTADSKLSAGTGAFLYMGQSGSGGFKITGSYSITIGDANNRGSVSYQMTVASDYTGGTVIDYGKLALNNYFSPSSTGFMGPGTVTVNANGVLDIFDYNISNNITLNGGILTGGSTSATGNPTYSGVITLTANSTIAGFNRNAGVSISTGGIISSGNYGVTIGTSTYNGVVNFYAVTSPKVYSYTGDTIIAYGTLNLSSDAPVTSSSLVRVDTNGALRLTGSTFSKALTLNGGSLISSTTATINSVITLTADSKIAVASGQTATLSATGSISGNFGLTYGVAATNVYTGIYTTPQLSAGSFSTNTYYVINSLGTTDFTLIGASSNTVGTQFKATGAGTGTGTAITANSPTNYTGIAKVSSSNSYTGITNIAYGTLQLGTAGTAPNSPLGTVAGGTVVASGATLDLNGLNLSTDEPLTLNGTGISNGGALKNSFNSASSTYKGLVTLGSSSSIVAGPKGIVLSNTSGQMTGDGYTLSFDGEGEIKTVIATGAGGVTKTGTAYKLVLSGLNTYTGPTKINGGFMSVSTLADGGFASGIGQSSNAASNLVFGGPDAKLEYTGGTISTDRLLTLNSNAYVSNQGTGTLTFSNTGNIVNATSTAGTYTFNLYGNTQNGVFKPVLVDGSSTAILAVSLLTSGTWTLGGSNTYSGGTTITAGTLQISSDANLGAVPNSPTINITFSGGRLLASGHTSAFTIHANRNISLGTGSTSSSNGTIANNSSANTLNIAGIISGSSYVSTGTVTSGLTIGSSGNTGTVILSGNNVYSGGTKIAFGTLQFGSAYVANGTTITSSPVGTRTMSGSNIDLTVAIQAGAALDLNGYDFGSSTYTNTTSFPSISLLGTGSASQALLINSSATPATVYGVITLDKSSYNAIAQAASGSLTVAAVIKDCITGCGGNGTPGTSTSLQIGARINNTNYAGTVILSGANTFAGAALTISYGTLKFGSSYIVSGSSTTSSPIGKVGITIGAGANLDLNGQDFGSSLLSTNPTITMSGTDATAQALLMNSSATAVTVYAPITLSAVTTANTLANVIAQAGSSSLTVVARIYNSGAIASGLQIGTNIGGTDYAGKVIFTGSAVTASGSYTGLTSVNSYATLDLKLDSTNTTTSASFNSSYAGAGTIIIEPLTAGGTIALGGTGSTLNLASTLFSGGSRKFADGFANVVIGSSSAGAITITGTNSFSDSVTLISSGDITINSGASVSSSEASGNLVVAASGYFKNLSGSSALQTTDSGSTDRWIVYSTDPTGTNFGASGTLQSLNKAYWGSTYTSLAPSLVGTGNRYVFSAGGTVTVTTTNASMTYGLPIDLSSYYSASNISLNAAPTGAPFTSNTAADLLATAPTIASTGNTASASVGTYPITASDAVGAVGFGTITYSNTGILTVRPAVITLGLVGTKTYDGSGVFSSGLTVNGLANGDTLDTATANSANVADNGSNYFVSFTLSSGTASNYALVNGYDATTNAATINKAPAYVLVTAGQSSTYGSTPIINYTFYNNASGTGGSAITTSTTGTASFTNEPTVTSNAATYALTYDSGLTADNYELNPVTSAVNYVVNKATIVLNSSNTTSTYDGTAKQNEVTATVNGTATSFSSLPAGASTISGGGSSAPITNSTSVGNYIYLNTSLGSDAFRISGAADRTNAGTTADNFALTAYASNGTLASNYDIVYNNRQLVINPAPIGVSVTGTYTGSTTIAPTSFQFSGLVNNETVTALTSATVNNANVSSNGANYVTALVSGGGTADLSNYVITAGYQVGSVGTDTNGVFSGSTSGTATNSGGTNIATLNKADAYVIVTNGQSSDYGTAPSTINYTFNADSSGSGAAITSPLGLTGTASFTGLPSSSSVVNTYGVNYDTGLSATNYNFNPAALNTDFSVTPIALTITASAQSTTYGTALVLDTTAYTSSGLINGDSISSLILRQGGNTTVPSTQNAGTYSGSTDGIIPSNAQGSGLGNYTITYTAGTLTINQKALSITASNDSKTYGVTKTYGAGSTAFTSSGLVNGETINSVTITDINSGGLPGANVGGTYALTPSAPVGITASNYSITYNDGALSVGKATLTYNATPTNSTYGSTPSVNSGTVTGFVNNETATVLTGSLLFSTTATATSNVGSYGITGSGYSSNNYDFVQAAANVTALTIGQKALTITANAQINTYGSTLVLGTSAFTNSVLETGDTISSVTLTQGGNTTVPATQGAGVYSGATNGILASAASGTGLGNYLITYLPGTLTINKATLTVTADSQARVYGDVNSTLTYTISGYVNGQNLGSSGVTGAATISTTATHGSNVGNYTITSAANNLAATNYDFSYVDGTLTVNRRPVTVTAENKSKIYGDVNPVLTYTVAANGVGSSRGLYGTDSLTGDPATTATQATGVGTVTITQGTLTNTNNGNYAITFNDGTLTINPAQLTVTANANAKFVTQSDVANFNGVNYTGFVNGDTATNLTGILTVNRTNATENNAGVYMGVLQPAGLSSSNYSITYAVGNYTIIPAQTLLVDVINQNITYGAVPTFVIDSVKYLDGQNVIHTLTQDSRSGDTYTYIDGVGGSATFTLTTSAGLSSSNYLVVGNYSLLGTNFSKVSNNFNNNPVYTGNMAVQQKALTAGTSSVSKVYDGSASMANLNISLNPIISGDVVTASGQGAFSQAGVGSGLTYSVSNLALTGADAGNYYLSGGTSFSGNNGEITKAPLGISVTASYNGTTTVTPSAATITGLVNNETLTVTSVGLNSAKVADNSTNYVTSILASSGTASMANYQLNTARNEPQVATNTTNTVTLNPVAITVTANNQSRLYGAANPTSGAVTLTAGTLYGGDTLSTASLSTASITGPAVATTAAGQTKDLVPSNQTFTVSDAAQNYTINYLAGTLTINKAPIGIQVAGTYNGTTSITPTSVTITGLANGETLNPSAVVVNDKNVAANGSNYVTAITPTAGDTAALSNYELTLAYNGTSATTTSNAVTINKANLTVAATPSLSGNVYNGSAYTGAYTTTAVNGETFTVTGVATGTNAGTYASNLVVTGAALANYNTPTINNANLVISPKTVTITNTASATTYDGTTSYAGLMNTAGFTNTALVGSDSIASVTQTATVNGSTVTGLAQAGTFVSTPSVAVMGVGLLTNYAFTYQAATNTVAKANLMVTANNATKIYDGVVYSGGNGVTYVGLVGGEQSTVLGGLLAYNGTSQNAINAASYTIIPSGFTSNNYDISYTSGVLTISQRAVTLTANAQSTTYGTALALGTSAYTISVGTLATGDAISAVSLQYNSNATVAATTNAGTYTGGIVASGATGSGRFNTSNYNITYAAGTLTVNKATLTVTADAQSRVYGDANPTLTQTISGFVNGQILATSGVTGSAYGSTTATTANNIGTYTIAASASGLTSNNYQFTTTNGILTVNPRPITVTADAKTKVYGSANPALSYTVAADGVGTSRGLYGSDTLSGTLSVNAGTATPVGTVTITQNTVSNTNYAITYVAGNLTITPATLAVTGYKTYDGSIVIAGTDLTVTGVNGERFTAGGNANLISKNVQVNQNLADVDRLTLTPLGGALVSNYAPLDVTNTQFTVYVKAVTLTAPSITKTYDGGYAYTMTSTDLAAMSSQLVPNSGDTVTTASVSYATNGADTNKRVDLNSVTISDGNGGNNYSVTRSYSTTSVINKAPLIIKAANDAKFVTTPDVVGYSGVYGDGFVNGEGLANLSGTVSISRTNAGVNAVNMVNNVVRPYAGVLVPSGYTSNNYDITFAAGDYTIIPAQTLLIRVAPTNVTYGDITNVSAPAYSYTAQYLPAATQQNQNPTPVTLTPTTPVNGIYTLNDGAGGEASFKITAVNPSYSSTNRLVVGGYDMVESNVNVTGNNFLSMLTVGALTVAHKVISSTNLGITGISKVYDGSAAISAALLNVNAASSQVLSGDRVDVYATGTYNDENVGTAKSVVVDVSLSTPFNLINDAANYSLSSTRVTGNLGTITQLYSVTYSGPSGGNWANPSNWTTTGTNVTGATPTFSFAANMPNVVNVIIPVGSNVVYDSASVGNSGSAINNSGTITFNGANNFTWTDNVSGTGGVNLTGVGTLTLAGNNSYSGGTNIHASSLVIGSASALGSAALGSNGGHLSMANNITATNLTVNGNVSLLSDIRTSGAQIYNGDVLIGGSTGMGATPITLTAGSIQFMGTLMSGSIGTYINGVMGNYQSLVINAGNGQVEFADRVGSDVLGRTYATVWRNPLYMQNLYSLVVNARTTLVKGDITTFEAQTYNTKVLIGNNGSNGLTRTFLSEDPTITFNGTVDDTQVNTHTLVVKAVSISGNANELPVININDAIGATKALASLEVSTGSQDTLPDLNNVAPLFSKIFVGRNQYNGKINIAADVTTVGDQIYTANAILIGDANASSPTVNVIDMTSQSGSVIYNTGTNTSDPSYVPGLQGVGSGATVNVTAANGVVTGEDNPSQLSVNAFDSQTGINNPANNSDRYSAALFTSEAKRHFEMIKLDKSANVTVGEAGVVENGEVHSFNDIKPCAKGKNKNDEECAPNKE